MDKIHKLLLVILIASVLTLNLMAEGIDNTDNNMNFSGIMNLGYGYGKGNFLNKENETKEIFTSNLQLNADYENDDFYFQSTLFGYAYTMPNNEKAHLMNYHDEYEKQDVFFRSLYGSYKINQNLSVGVGYLAFSNSTPSKYSNDYIQDGEGIYMLNDNTLAAAFAVYKEGNSRTIVGIGTIDETFIDTGMYIDDALRKGGAYTIFAINTYNYEKFTFTSEFLYNSLTYEKKDLSDVYQFGFATAWDDSDNSGWSFYNVLGASIYDNHNEDAKEAIFKNVLGPKAKYGDYIMAKHPDNFAIENKKYYGAAMLWGFRKDFEIGRQEFFTTAEWFHTFGDWSSGNQGNIYLCQDNQVFNVRDDSYYVTLGYIINDQATVRLAYTYSEYDEKGKIGAPSSTVDTEDYIGPQINKIEIMRIMFSYKF